MLPTPMPCSIVDSTSTSFTPVQRRRVAILGLHEVGDRVGQRPIVTNAACEHVVHVPANALVHDA